RGNPARGAVDRERLVVLRRERARRARRRGRLRPAAASMTLVLLIGGARSGKSRLALERAEQEGAPVVFVATGEALDAEMTERIERHKAERPDAWTTIEEPIELERALAAVPDRDTAIVDWPSLWVA